jgi:hypothetical protein
MHELEQITSRDRGWWRTWVEIRLQRAQTACITDLPLWDPAASAELREAVEMYGTRAQKARCHLAIADALFFEGRWAVSPRCVEELRLGVECALQTDSLFLQSFAVGVLGSTLVFAGEYHEAEVRLRQAIDLSERCRDTVGERAATLFLSIAARLQGDVRRAEHLALELKALLAGQASQSEFECMALGQLGWVALRRGDLTTARQLSEEAVGLWEHDPSMTQSVWVMSWPAVYCALEMGDCERAFEYAAHMTRTDQQVLAAEMDRRLAGAIDAHRQGDPAGESRLRDLAIEARGLGYA